MWTTFQCLPQGWIFYVYSEMFDRSAGLLTGLDDLVDRASTNKLAGGFSGMGRNINATKWIFDIF